MAAFWGKEKIVEKLIETGANPFLVDYKGETGLDMAKNNAEIKKLLENYMQKCEENGLKRIFDIFGYLPFEYELNKDGELSKNTINNSKYYNELMDMIEDCHVMGVDNILNSI